MNMTESKYNIFAATRGMPPKEIDRSGSAAPSREMTVPRFLGVHPDPAYSTPSCCMCRRTVPWKRNSSVKRSSIFLRCIYPRHAQHTLIHPGRSRSDSERSDTLAVGNSHTNTMDGSINGDFGPYCIVVINGTFLANIWFGRTDSAPKHDCSDPKNMRRCLVA